MPAKKKKKSRQQYASGKRCFQIFLVVRHLPYLSREFFLWTLLGCPITNFPCYLDVSIPLGCKTRIRLVTIIRAMYRFGPFAYPTQTYRVSRRGLECRVLSTDAVSWNGVGCASSGERLMFFPFYHCHGSERRDWEIGKSLASRSFIVGFFCMRTKMIYTS